MAGADVLCLASGGGQQAPTSPPPGPTLPCSTTRRNNSRRTPSSPSASRSTSRPSQGDMRDLSAFADESFDLVFHPVSNLFVPEVRPVWKEAFRVLRSGGSLLAGFLNPVVYVFDLELADEHGRVQGQI